MLTKEEIKIKRRNKEIVKRSARSRRRARKAVKKLSNFTFEEYLAYLMANRYKKPDVQKTMCNCIIENLKGRVDIELLLLFKLDIKLVLILIKLYNKQHNS